LDVTPRYKARLTIELRAGVIVGRIENIVRHRAIKQGATSLDTVYLNEI
jgi:hypothetical protein